MTKTPGNRQAFASRTLLKHLAAMAARAEGVREADDIEHVHQMRVASRRLRNAMTLLADAIPAKRYSRWLRRIKKVTSALGAARDADVQILAVDEFIAKLQQQGDKRRLPGVQRLRLRLAQQREKLQPKVVKAMDNLDKSDVIAEMRSWLLQMKVASRIGVRKSLDSDLKNEAGDVIEMRLEEMLAYEPFIWSPQHVEELHAMRIAAKHLRYTLETYGSLFKGGLKWQIKMIKGYQSLLGDIHDADMWLEMLPQFIEAERQRHSEFFGHLRGFKKIETGVGYMLEDRASLRRKLYNQFVAQWEKDMAEGRWEELRGSVQHLHEEASRPVAEDGEDDQPPAMDAAAAQ